MGNDAFWGGSDGRKRGMILGQCFFGVGAVSPAAITMMNGPTPVTHLSPGPVGTGT